MENFTKEEVVPDVVRAVPAAKLTVQWEDKDLEPGATWTPTNVQNKPSVQWRSEDGALYTLVLVDPDAPSRANPVMGEILHWLVVNIPGCDVTQGEEFAAYIGSGAPKDSGLHRYCFFVFKQAGTIQVDLEKADKHTVGPRRKFKLQGFVDKHNLGTAVAANFFLAEYDDFVPKLRSQFKDL